MVYEHAVYYDGIFYHPGEDVPIAENKSAKNEPSEPLKVDEKLFEAEETEATKKRGRPRKK